MTASPQARHSLKQRIGGWFYDLIFKPGWPRRVLFALAVIVFILAGVALTARTDYREDPSTLVPRSVEVYAEAKELGKLFKNVGGWKLWATEEGVVPEDQWPQLQRDVASLIGDTVPGLGRRQPLLWLSMATKAAYCLVPGEKEGDGESWALLLHLGSPQGTLAELAVEKGLHLEKGAGGVSVLSSTNGGADGGGKLYFAAMEPWLIVSSAEKLPAYALESLKKPAFSLARSGLLPKWSRSISVRGLFNPAHGVSAREGSAYALVTGWMAQDVRINFTARIGDSGGVEMYYNAGLLTDKVRGGGLWPLVCVLLVLVALVALALVFAILLVMVGWGGWLKGLAWKAGIHHADAPAPVQSSAAFREDVGLTPPVGETEAKDGKDKNDVVPTENKKSLEAVHSKDIPAESTKLSDDLEHKQIDASSALNIDNSPSGEEPHNEDDANKHSNSEDVTADSSNSDVDMENKH